MPEANAELNHLLRFDHEWREGDRAVARQLAAEYVESRAPELAAMFGALDAEALTRLADRYAEYEQYMDLLVIRCWVLTRIPKRHISGAIAIGPAQMAEAMR